nr:Hypothetical protein CBG23547 [Haemonchus contortus]
MDSSSRTPQQPPKQRRHIDNSAEVRRRKEAAERLIRERHEALRRQHEEKIMKINEERQRQQRELKERHAKELKRQQDVLQRRMALMERDNARKKEILEKNHAVVSRLANNSSRKNYAFGSSTPRELSFLEGRLKNIAQEKRSSPEKQNSNGSVNTPTRRPGPAAMSSSMYVPSNPDRGRHTSSVTRLSQPKNTPTKQQNLMTQSVYSQSTNSCVSPASRLQRKPLSQLTASVPNTPLASVPPPERQRKPKPKSKPRGLPVTSANNKKSTPTAKLSKSVSELARKESIHSNDTHSSIGARTSESPLLDASSTSDEVPQEMQELESNKEVVVMEVEQQVKQREDEVEQNGDGSQHHSEPEEMPLASQPVATEHNVSVHSAVDHQEQASEEESMQKAPAPEVEEPSDSSAVAELISISEAVDTNSVISEAAHGDVASAPSLEKGGASLADELAGIFDAPLPPPPISVVVEDCGEGVSPSSQPAENVEGDHKEEPVSEIQKEEPAAETPEGNHAMDAAQVNTTAVEVKTDVVEEHHTESSPLNNKPDEEISDAGIQKNDITNNVQEDQASVKQPSEMNTEEQVPPPKEAVDVEPKAAVDSHAAVAQVNGIEKSAVPPAVITELPGTVPTTKETDETVVKKVPTPPNEFIAHRLRREQEQRELDERKARIAAILAKSRNLSNATTPLVAGRTSPPRTESAQDVLKRLASNGNIPALQKLVARHASETAAIEQTDSDGPVNDIILRVSTDLGVLLAANAAI